jgi:hypothetical protein
MQTFWERLTNPYIPDPWPGALDGGIHVSGEVPCLWILPHIPGVVDPEFGDLLHVIAPHELKTAHLVRAPA